ncbi:hypothetical protein BFW87_03090 [Pseudomonas fluorescens]|uniref:Chemotaxis protein n=1 Tax=Pseudomonas fluorescens TaxID=294 RepID=A0A1T2Z562_PSEFL|nr:hypothetical protein [Pseudomonas fluorescens]OPA99714.1 hypothetical protein BFW87_03090 [Pseudomonas fluorescens]
MSVNPLNNPVITTKAVPVVKISDLLEGKKVEDKPAAPPTPGEGVVVTISGAGLKAAQGGSNPNKDIDDSGLKDNIKQLLKMIRELRKQLAEKMAQLSAVMNDTALSPDARQAKVAGLQGDIASIQSGLMTAMAQLAKSLKDESPEANMTAMALLAK